MNRSLRVFLFALFFLMLTLTTVPPVAQAQVLGVSVAPTVEYSYVVGECTTYLSNVYYQDPIDNWQYGYSGVYVNCNLQNANTGESYWCSRDGWSSVTATCSVSSTVKNPGVYWDIGYHYVYLTPAPSCSNLCTSNACPYIDPLNYLGYNLAYGIPSCTSSPCGFYGLGNVMCDGGNQWVEVGYEYSSPTPAMGIYPIQAGPIGPSQSVQFSANESSVYWYVDNIPGGDSTVGTISANGLYTAPASVASVQSHTILAINTSTAADYAQATVSVVPISVYVEPRSAQTNQGRSVQFSASVDHANNTGVNWAVDGITLGNDAVGKISSYGVYTAPDSVAIQSTHMITATSQQDPTRSDTVSISLLPVNITVYPPPPFVVTNPPPSVTMSATADGWLGTPPLTWSTGGNCAGSRVTPNSPSTTATYTPPSITRQCTDIVTVTDQTGNPPPTGSTTVILVPPVTITPLSNWYAGQSTAVTISGSGFGTAPTVTLNPPIAPFNFTSSGDNQIQGVVSIPATNPSMVVAVNVTNTTAPPGTVGNLTGTTNVTVVAPTITVAISPGSVSLQETQTQQFTANVTCKTGGGQTCTVPTTVTWSLTPGLGTINSSGLYTASATGLTGNTAVTLKACSTVNTTACGTATITLQPVTVGSVTPASATLTPGKTQQFAVTIQGAVNPALNWSVNGTVGGNGTVGTVTSNGLYTAPNSIPSPTVSVNACSVLDPSRCSPNPATVMLQGFTLSATPLSQTAVPGGTATYAVSAASVNGYAATVALSTTVPAGMTASISPGTINMGESATLTVSIPSGMAMGTYALSVTGASGSLPAVTQNLTLQVQGFTISVTPGSQTVAPGGTTTYTVTASPVNGFSGTVALSMTSSPTGPTPSFNPASVGMGGTSTMTVTVPGTAGGGTYTLTVTGVSGAMTVTKNASLTVQPPPPSGSVSITGIERRICVMPPGGRLKSDCEWVYDYGDVSVTVNGHLYSAPYGSQSSQTSIASALANAMGSDPYVTVTASGSVITLVSKSTACFTLSATSASDDPWDFDAPSFHATASGPTCQ